MNNKFLKTKRQNNKNSRNNKKFNLTKKKKNKNIKEQIGGDEMEISSFPSEKYKNFLIQIFENINIVDNEISENDKKILFNNMFCFIRDNIEQSIITIPKGTIFCRTIDRTNFISFNIYDKTTGFFCNSNPRQNLFIKNPYSINDSVMFLKTNQDLQVLNTLPLCFLLGTQLKSGKIFLNDSSNYRGLFNLEKNILTNIIKKLGLDGLILIDIADGINYLENKIDDNLDSGVDDINFQQSETTEIGIKISNGYSRNYYDDIKINQAFPYVWKFKNMKTNEEQFIIGFLFPEFYFLPFDKYNNVNFDIIEMENYNFYSIKQDNYFINMKDYKMYDNDDDNNNKLLYYLNKKVNKLKEELNANYNYNLDNLYFYDLHIYSDPKFWNSTFFDLSNYKFNNFVFDDNYLRIIEKRYNFINNNVIKQITNDKIKNKIESVYNKCILGYYNNDINEDNELLDIFFRYICYDNDCDKLLYLSNCKDTNCNFMNLKKVGTTMGYKLNYNNDYDLNIIEKIEIFDKNRKKTIDNILDFNILENISFRISSDITNNIFYNYGTKNIYNNYRNRLLFEIHRLIDKNIKWCYENEEEPLTQSNKLEKMEDKYSNKKAIEKLTFGLSKQLKGITKQKKEIINYNEDDYELNEKNTNLINELTTLSKKLLILFKKLTEKIDLSLYYNDNINIIINNLDNDDYEIIFNFFDIYLKGGTAFRLLINNISNNNKILKDYLKTINLTEYLGDRSDFDFNCIINPFILEEDYNSIKNIFTEYFEIYFRNLIRDNNILNELLNIDIRFPNYISINSEFIQNLSNLLNNNDELNIDIDITEISKPNYKIKNETEDIESNSFLYYQNTKLNLQDINIIFELHRLMLNFNTKKIVNPLNNVGIPCTNIKTAVELIDISIIDYSSSDRINKYDEYITSKKFSFYGNININGRRTLHKFHLHCYDLEHAIKDLVKVIETNILFNNVLQLKKLGKRQKRVEFLSDIICLYGNDTYKENNKCNNLLKLYKDKDLQFEDYNIFKINDNIIHKFIISNKQFIGSYLSMNKKQRILDAILLHCSRLINFNIQSYDVFDYNIITGEKNILLLDYGNQNIKNIGTIQQLIENLYSNIFKQPFNIENSYKFLYLYLNVLLNDFFNNDDILGNVFFNNFINMLYLDYNINMKINSENKIDNENIHIDYNKDYIINDRFIYDYLVKLKNKKNIVYNFYNDYSFYNNKYYIDLFSFINNEINNTISNINEINEINYNLRLVYNNKTATRIYNSYAYRENKTLNLYENGLQNIDFSIQYDKNILNNKNKIKEFIDNFLTSLIININNNIPIQDKNILDKIKIIENNNKYIIYFIRILEENSQDLSNVFNDIGTINFSGFNIYNKFIVFNFEEYSNISKKILNNNTILYLNLNNNFENIEYFDYSKNFIIQQESESVDIVDNIGVGEEKMQF